MEEQFGVAGQEKKKKDVSNFQPFSKCHKECLCHIIQCFEFFTSSLSCDPSHPSLIISNGSLTWELFRLLLLIGYALTGRDQRSKEIITKPIIFGVFGSL